MARSGSFVSVSRHLERTSSLLGVGEHILAQSNVLVLLSFVIALSLVFHPVLLSVRSLLVSGNFCLGQQFRCGGLTATVDVAPHQSGQARHGARARHAHPVTVVEGKYQMSSW